MQTSFPKLSKIEIKEQNGNSKANKINKGRTIRVIDSIIVNDFYTKLFLKDENMNGNY